ncbi:hypothetical protein B9Z55_028917 [Caenorhabditis nigoni]|uniref:Uncharacterized protein n=1 Tax=Caenorhabditis nigoni TaxID=1611254 RepID=A0A2G5S9J8_9PELO|nr:hypothetical protein B9Z55_028917 [Caenorhabditis nigoni]
MGATEQRRSQLSCQRRVGKFRSARERIRSSVSLLSIWKSETRNSHSRMSHKLEVFLLLALVATGFGTYWLVMESQDFDTLFDFGENLYARGYNETKNVWKIASPWIADNFSEFMIWSGYKEREAIEELADGVDLNEVRTRILPLITLSTPTSTTAAPGKRTCAQCTGGNYHLRKWLMQNAEHDQSMGWVEEWALTDCVVGKIRLIPCATACMTVTIQRPENGEKLDSIMMDCADDMIHSRPDIPDTRPWYKSINDPLVFEENARYVAQRVGHTIIYEFNITSSDSAATIANNLKEKFVYVKNEKKLGDNNKGLFIICTMLTMFLIFACCSYCIYHRCRRWCIRREFDNTEEMMELAVYLENGLSDVPKASGRIRRKDKLKKTVTFRAELEEIIEDVEEDFDDDFEPDECYAPKMVVENLSRVQPDVETAILLSATVETQTDFDDLEDHETNVDEDDEESSSSKIGTSEKNGNEMLVSRETINEEDDEDSISEIGKDSVVKSAKNLTHTTGTSQNN